MPFNIHSSNPLAMFPAPVFFYLEFTVVLRTERKSRRGKGQKRFGTIVQATSRI